jgi:hemerythrin-like domain-containing protein
MNQILNTNIKEVLERYPGVAEPLKQHDIGCVSCSVGTCLLKDIIGIHNLSQEAGEELMTAITLIVHPDGDVAVPKIERKTKSQPKAASVKFSPPMQKMVDEHSLIKRLLAVIPNLIEDLDLDSEAGRQQVSSVIDFIRSFADKYHHSKEEDVLFKYFDADLDIIKAMYSDHENGRSKVRQMLAALEARDKSTLALNLKGYQELLSEHIKKEDEILYRWMERNLTTKQIGEIFARCVQIDEEFSEKQKKYENLVSQMESSNLVKEKR